MVKPHLHMTADSTKPAVIALEVDSGWTVIRDFSATVNNNVVHLQGYAQKTSSASKTLLTLPAEIAPNQTLLFLGYNSGKPNPTYIEIYSDGKVSIFGSKWDLSDVKTVALDACSWVIPTTE